MASGFGTGSTVCPTDQQTVLNAVLLKIRTEITQFNSSTLCFLNNNPSSIEVNDNLFCTVSPENDSFAPDDPVGGADLGIIEVSAFRVTVWSRIELDPLEKEDIAFTDATRGILPLKKLILKCLAGRQLFSDYPTNTVPLLIEFCRPVVAQHPPHGQHIDEFSSFSIIFEAPFYWNLT